MKHILENNLVLASMILPATVLHLVKMFLLGNSKILHTRSLLLLCSLSNILEEKKNI